MIINHTPLPETATPARCSAFTMIELVVVLVIVGALAFVAIPRLNVGSLQVMPVAEQIAAEVRYAQNLALTRAEEHTFQISGNTISIDGPGATLSTGDLSKTFSDVTITGPNVMFTPRFGETTGGTITVTSNGSSVEIRVVSETGYVYIEE